MFGNFDKKRTNKVLSDAVTDTLLSYVQQRGWKNTTTISDSNTYPLISRKIHRELQSGGIRNSDIILNGSDLIADERSIMTVLTEIDINTEALIAVGSGTITDIVRFVSHRLQKEFISIATAPSMDGYTSSGAPIILRGYKRYIACQSPSLLIASPSMLSRAPRDMIVAGFGEVLGKIIALADLELAHLLTKAPFDRTIAEHTLLAYSKAMGNATEIGQKETTAVMVLFEALTTSGESMRRFGSSDSISGSEHHISHFLEMRHLVSNKTSVLHGIKIAIGAIISAQWYRSLRNMNKEDVLQQKLQVPDYGKDLSDIEELLGEPGKILLEENTYISTLDIHRVAQIRTRLLDHWNEVQSIAARVPEPEELSEFFNNAGGRTIISRYTGLTDDEIRTAARLSHYVRNRFTIKTLLFTLGLPSNILFNYQ